MLNRLIALPAVACIALAAGLGAWGWSDREGSRDRAAAEDLRRDAVEYLGPGASAEWQMPDELRFLQACDALRRVATLDRTVGAGQVAPFDPIDPDDPGVVPTVDDPTVTLPVADAAGALLNMLDPVVVLDVPGLDDPVLLALMADLRDQINGAMAVDHDPFASPNVQAAAQALGDEVFIRC